jgi:hypothetical protein
MKRLYWGAWKPSIVVDELIVPVGTLLLMFAFVTGIVIAAANLLI